ncbi:MAG: UPF0149 family protein [Colwellia sp.]|jgi:Uncharacterized protein conserved in bacteria
MPQQSHQHEKLTFASTQAILTSENVQTHASEIHGVLAGLVCAGFAFEDQGYLVMLTDLFNNNEAFPTPVKTCFKQMFSELWENIIDDAYTFQPMLPDDDDTLVERGHALGAWVQGFNLGFGLQQKDSPVTSNEIKEILVDFAEIANLSDEMEEDEDTEQAYFEISEYVRISALLCFTELGASPATSNNLNNPVNKIIH